MVFDGEPLIGIPSTKNFAVTLTFYPYLKCHHLAFVHNCTQVVNFMKFAPTLDMSLAELIKQIP